MESSIEAKPTVSTTAAIGWAVYVAVSWTWVIGMFLPVLLVRDFGLLGWAVFAVPNVIGAASVGFVMRSSRQSAEFTLKHRRAVAAFTVVTLALQCFALGWLTTSIRGGWVGFLVTFFVAIVGYFGKTLSPAAQVGWAVLTWLLSATVGVVLLAGGFLSVPATSVEAPLGLVGLAAACALGFLLCPYLDVSLQAARQAAGDRAKLAFGLGYGLFFLVMIALTLGYAIHLPGLMKASFGNFIGLAAVLIVAHLAAQVLFTNAAHLSALTRLADAAGDESIRPNLAWLALVVFAALAGWMAGALNDFSVMPVGYAPGELVYRAFLTFYGLLFPAYLLLGFGRWFWTSVVLAAPWFALGFFGGPTGWTMGWAAIGVLVLLICFGIRRFSRNSPPL